MIHRLVACAFLALMAFAAHAGDLAWSVFDPWRPPAGRIPTPKDLKRIEASLPKDMIAVGQEPNRKALMLCRARYKDAIHPGKLVDARCNIAADKKEIAIDAPFEVLTGDPRAVRWMDLTEVGQRGLIPFIAGKEPGRFLRVCRASHADGVHPGVLVAGECRITYGGKQIGVKKSTAMMATQFEAIELGDALPPGFAWAKLDARRLPDDAVVAGGSDAPATQNDDRVGICRAVWQDSMQVGMARRSCTFGFAGAITDAAWGNHGEVLVGPANRVRWVATSDGKSVPGEFAAGEESLPGLFKTVVPARKLVVCRYKDPKWTAFPYVVGKVVGSGCSAGIDGQKERSSTSYEVMVLK